MNFLKSAFTKKSKKTDKTLVKNQSIKSKQNRIFIVNRSYGGFQRFDDEDDESVITDYDDENSMDHNYSPSSNLSIEPQPEPQYNEDDMKHNNGFINIDAGIKNRNMYSPYLNLYNQIESDPEDNIVTGFNVIGFGSAFADAPDKFADTIVNKTYIKLSNNNKTMQIKQNKKNNEGNCVYGAVAFKSTEPDIIRYNVKIDKLSTKSTIGIGFSSNCTIINQSLKKAPKNDLDDAYYFYTYWTDGRVIRNDPVADPRKQWTVTKKCKSGDIVFVILNLKEGCVRFGSVGSNSSKDYQLGTHGLQRKIKIGDDISYRLVISAWNQGDKVSINKYEKLNVI